MDCKIRNKWEGWDGFSLTNMDEEKEISRAGKMKTKGRLSDRHGVQSYPGYSLVGEKEGGILDNLYFYNHFTYSHCYSDLTFDWYRNLFSPCEDS